MTSVAPPGAPPPSGSAPPPPRPTVDGDAASQGRRVERRVGVPNGRTVAGGLLMTLAAIAAFVLATSGDGDDLVEVVVADRDLRAGDVIETHDLRTVEVAVDGEVGGLFGSVEAAVGRTMVAPTDAGEFLLGSSTAERAHHPGGAFEMTLAVEPERTPGSLAAGEPVDIFATWNSGVTELIAVGATVLDVDEAGDDLIGGSELLIRLQVTDLTQVEAVVHAHASADVTLVRPPGDDTATVGRQYRPGEAVAGSTDEGEDG